MDNQKTLIRKIHCSIESLSGEKACLRKREDLNTYLAEILLAEGLFTHACIIVSPVRSNRLTFIHLAEDNSLLSATDWRLIYNSLFGDIHSENINTSFGSYSNEAFNSVSRISPLDKIKTWLALPCPLLREPAILLILDSSVIEKEEETRKAVYAFTRALFARLQGSGLADHAGKEMGLFYSIYNPLQEKVFAFDGSGTVWAMNEAARAELVCAGDVNNLNNLDNLLGNDCDNLPDAYQALNYAWRGQQSKVSIWCRRPNGSQYIQDVRFVPAYHLGAGIVIGIFSDLTPAKLKEIEDREQLERILQQQEIIATLALDKDVADGDHIMCAKLICEYCSYLYAAERVSVWLYNENYTELDCIELFTRSDKQHSSGYVVKEKDFKSEFEALRTSLYVDANDPYTDWRTKGYIENYLTPLRITSMLDTVIRSEDKMLGVLCIEHVDKPHTWIAHEIDFACQMTMHFAHTLERKIHRQAREELEHNRQRFQELFNATSDAIFVHDAGNGQFIDCNKVAEDVYGYTKQEFLNMDIGQISDIDSGYTHERAVGNLRNALENGQVITEWRARRRNGTSFWVEIKLTVSEISGYLYVMAMVRDIDTRKRQEEEMSRHAERLRAMVSTIDEIVFEFDEEGNYLSIWVEDESLLLLPRAQMIGKNLNEIRGLQDGDHFRQTIVSVMKNKVPEILEYRANVQAGSRWFQGRFNPIFNADGTVTTVSFIARDITARKLNEQLLRENENFMLEAQAAARIGFFKISLNDGTWTGTKQLFDMIGLPPRVKYPLGEWYSLIIPAERQSIEEYLNRDVFSGNEKFSKEFQIMRPSDACIIWVSGSGTIHHDENNAPILIGTLQDITDRKNVELSLHQSETRFKELADVLPQTIFEVDLQGKILYANKISFPTFGYMPEEVMDTLTIMDFIAGEDHERARKNIHAALEGKNQGLKEYTACKKDGTRFPVVIQSLPIIQDGKPVGLRGLLIDISERKKAEQDLRESEELLRNLINAMPDIVCFKDARGANILANEFVVKLFGLEGVDYRGKRDSELAEFSANYREALLACVESDERAWRAMVQTRGDECIPHPDGTLQIFDIIKLPTFLPDGSRKGLIVVGRDITERKKVEQELIQAKERAEEMSTLKSSFLANMSHELRTPLIGILGFSEILAGAIENNEQRRMAETIHVSGERLLTTLNALLNLAKIEANRQEMHVQFVDLHEIIRRNVKLFEMAAKNRGLELISWTTMGEAFIEADLQMLDSVCNNLISNAIKYTEHGTVTIKTNIREINSARFIEFSVSDTGIGIAPEKIDLVFDAFRQASEGYGRAFEGTGLGLTITRRYVELMKGTITLESNPGKGTTFTVLFPMVSPRVETSESVQQVDTANSPLENKYTILAVDDDPITLDLLSFLLTGYGVVECVSNSSSAIQAASERAYDLILLDINLGQGVTGLDVLDKIRNTTINSNVPVMALTSYAMEGDREHFLQRGCDYYLSKPFTKNQLLNQINQILHI